MSLLTPTLSDVMAGTFDELAQLVTGITTGGDGTTLVDSLLKGKDDSWNQGTAFITYDVGGSGAAPQGEFARITDYARGTGTVTANFSVDVATGDHYALASRRWTTDDMVTIINRALQRMGGVPKNDISLTTAANTTEYTLPAGFRELRRVYRHTLTTADNEQPIKMSDWRTENNILIFSRQPPAGVVLRLVGKGIAARMRLFGDTLEGSIPLERAIAESAYHALRFLIRRTEGEDRSLMQDLNDAADYRDEARAEWPVRVPLPTYKPMLLPTGRRNRGNRRSNRYGPYVL